MPTLKISIWNSYIKVAISLLFVVRISTENVWWNFYVKILQRYFQWIWIQKQLDQYWRKISMNFDYSLRGEKREEKTVRSSWVGLSSIMHTCTHKLTICISLGTVRARSCFGRLNNGMMTLRIRAYTAGLKCTCSSFFLARSCTLLLPRFCPTHFTACLPMW